MALDTVGLKQIGDVGTSKRPPVVRHFKNPMDVCTIVSVYPKKIVEVKHTIEPGKFEIEPGSLENPAILHVNTSSWWKNFDEQPRLEIPVSSVSIAESIIRDWCNGMLACDMSTAMPGLFFALGKLSQFQVKEQYKNDLIAVNEKQNNWFKALVRIADSLWARSNGNPLTISDEMRLAAKSLNHNDKAWLLDFKTEEMIKCMGCGSLKNPTFPICAVCRLIDQNHPEAKNFKFAGQ